MNRTPLWLWLRGCVLGLRELRRKGPKWLATGIDWLLVVLIVAWPVLAVYAAGRWALLPESLPPVLTAVIAFLVWFYGGVVPYLAGKQDAADAGAR